MLSFGNVAVGSFTSLASKADVSVSLGRIPDAVYFIDDISATNPKVYLWLNTNPPAVLSALTVTRDTAILLAGTNTLVTDAINQYAGGDTATSTTVTNKTYVDDSGTAIAAGVITSTGIFFDDTVQVNSGKAVWIALFGER